MTFTYIGDLSTDLDEIRFTVGDTVIGSGIKPNGVNFTDEEIGGLLTLEVTTGRTVARLYETLSAIWAKFIDTKMGSRDEKLSQVSARYAALAKKYRDDYGGGSGVTISIGMWDESISEDEST
jgi:hypothetical protein